MKADTMKPIIIFICSCLLFCSGPGKKDQDVLTLKSPAFKYGQKIPGKYTCDGENMSPEIVWSGVSKDTKCLVLTFEDLAGITRAVIHWVIFNIPPTSKGLPQNIPHRAQLPDGTQQAYNIQSQLGYLGPCPGSATHQYVFRLYALNSRIEEEPPLSPGKVILFIEDDTIARTELVGTYR
jgi:hypothetical protein